MVGDGVIDRFEIPYNGPIPPMVRVTYLDETHDYPVLDWFVTISGEEVAVVFIYPPEQVVIIIS